MQSPQNIFIFTLLYSILATTGCRIEHANSPLNPFIPLPGHKIELRSIDAGLIIQTNKASYSMPRLQSNTTTYWMSVSEIQVRSFCLFLQDERALYPNYAQQIIPVGKKQFRPRPGLSEKPIANVSALDAEAFCRWLSKSRDISCRLPSPEEWRYMANPGEHATPYPWGWDSPKERAVWNTERSKNSGTYPASQEGFVDVIGNVYEWSRDPTSGQSYIHGGAWSDKDPKMLQIQQQFEQAEDTHSPDIGFRILVDMPF